MLERLGPDIIGVHPLTMDLGQLPLELIQPFAKGAKRESVSIVLGLEPSGADAELNPAPGDVIDSDD